MGMNFSPMYQPVSTKTIKADGDLNINPYDLLATDVKCDTVEATEFVGGVGNFSSVLVGLNTTGGLFSTTLSTSGMPLFNSDNTNTGSFTISASNFVTPSALMDFTVTVESWYNGSFTTVITIAGFGSQTLTLPSKNSKATATFKLPAGSYTLTSSAWQRHTCGGSGASITYYAAIELE